MSIQVFFLYLKVDSSYIENPRKLIYREFMYTLSSMDFFIGKTVSSLMRRPKITPVNSEIINSYRRKQLHSRHQKDFEAHTTKLQTHYSGWTRKYSVKNTINLLIKKTK